MKAVDGLGLRVYSGLPLPGPRRHRGTVHRVLYRNHAAADVYAIIRGELPEGFELLALERDSDSERLRLLPQADFILVATARLAEEMIRAAPRLKLIQHQGVGYDTTDVAAARRLGIPVGLTPEGTTIGVAEHTLLLILAAYKRLAVDAAEVQKVKDIKSGKLIPDCVDKRLRELGYRL